MPPGGTPLDRPDSLIVPALAIALVGGAWLQRLVRAAIVDAAALPHVRAAHLAGHHSAAVAWRMISLRRPSLRSISTTLLWLIWVSVLIAAIAGPAVATMLGTPDPNETMTRSFDPPSSLHPLGTGRLGRDLLARMLNDNIGLVIPPAIAALIATAIGLALALVTSISPALRAITRSIIADIGIRFVTVVFLTATAACSALLLEQHTGARR